MAQALAGAFHAAWARIVPGSFERVGAEHAGIPIAHTFTALGFVDDIEAEAGGAEEGADAAAQAGPETSSQ